MDSEESTEGEPALGDVGAQRRLEMGEPRAEARHELLHRRYLDRDRGEFGRSALPLVAQRAQPLFRGRHVTKLDREVERTPDLRVELDAALLRAVDELIGPGAIGEATWSMLARELEVQQLLDVIFTVGAYEIIAWKFRTLELNLDNDLVALHEQEREAPG